jgi:hypothetical protein
MGSAEDVDKFILMSQLTPKLSGYDVFRSYLAVKLHFTTSYNYFKYNGKASTISHSAYMRRKDKPLFERLAIHTDPDELVDLLVANFIENDSLWVGDFLVDYIEVRKTHKKWKARIQALEHTYEDDLLNIISFCNDNSLAFLDTTCYNSATHPLLFRFLMEGMIHPETYIILGDFLPCLDIDHPCGDIIWKHEMTKLHKYKDFLNYDKEKMKTITQTRLKDLNKFK